MKNSVIPILLFFTNFLSIFFQYYLPRMSLVKISWKKTVPCYDRTLLL